MNAGQIKALLALGISGILAIILGYSVANEEYTLLILASYFVVAMVLLLFVDNVGLTAFGLISPLTIPVPLIWSFPFILITLGICTFKLILQSTLSQQRKTRNKVSALCWPYGIFFIIVLIRYLMDPVLPNFFGFGSNVTGFRSYLAYFSSFYLLFLIGHLIRTREQVLSLVRLMTLFSLTFGLILSVCVFTKSLMVAEILNFFGIVVTIFDNGLLRFLSLPAFGLLIMTVSLLPKLYPAHNFIRVLMFLFGVAAIILGGNRVGLVMALIVVVCIPISQGRYMKAFLITFTAGFLLLLASIAGSVVKGDVGLLRVFSLVSERLERKSGADDSVRWRQIRWERAWEEIQERPWVGHGYGGLYNAIIYESNSDVDSVEVDLASGSIHNGFLSCAHAFGIPAALYIIGLIIWSIYRNFRMAVFYAKHDEEMSQLHTFVFCYLVALIPAIGVGSDTHLTMLWFVFGLGIVVAKIKDVEIEAMEPAKEPESVVLHPIMLDNRFE
jgi:O-antigen ligase